MKKLLFFIFIAISSFASEYITLDSGKTVLLKDDGTWEDVTIVKKGSKTIALKKDGTWEDVTSKNIQPAHNINTNANINTNTNKYMNTKYAKALLGKWQSEDGNIEYIFRDKKAVFKKDGKVYEGKWSIKSIDKKNNSLIVSIGEGASLGFLSFGGVSRNLRFSNDFNTLYDDSEKLEKLVDVKLHKID